MQADSQVTSYRGLSKSSERRVSYLFIMHFSEIWCKIDQGWIWISYSVSTGNSMKLRAWLFKAYILVSSMVYLNLMFWLQPHHVIQNWTNVTNVEQVHYIYWAQHEFNFAQKVSLSSESLYMKILKSLSCPFVVLTFVRVLLKYYILSGVKFLCNSSNSLQSVSKQKHLEWLKDDHRAQRRLHHGWWRRVSCFYILVFLKTIISTLSLFILCLDSHASLSDSESVYLWVTFSWRPPGPLGLFPLHSSVPNCPAGQQRSSSPTSHYYSDTTIMSFHINHNIKIMWFKNRSLRDWLCYN